MIKRDPTDGAEQLQRISDETEKKIDEHARENSEKYVDEE
jgi:hypothetical protein